MTLPSTIRSAVASIISSHSELGVTVQIGSVSGTGLKVLTTRTTDQSFTTGGNGFNVRVSTATFEEPKQGTAILVDSKQVFVASVRESGGLYVIECIETKPVADA